MTFITKNEYISMVAGMLFYALIIGFFPVDGGKILLLFIVGGIAVWAIDEIKGTIKYFSDKIKR